MTRRTLSKSVSTSGTALHAGGTVHMTLAPAPAHTGIVFRRSDLGGKEIPALYDHVGETRLGTVIVKDDASVGVIEHLMAAAAGAEIDDMVVTLDGPEPPILDGDALSYLALIEQAGVVEQEGTRLAIRVLKPVEVGKGEARAALLPAEHYGFDFEIVFPTPAIGTQTMDWTFSRAGFRADIAPARTFGFMHELEALNKMGLGRGASLENTLAIDGDAVVNASLMRFPDEFVRHKILDAIGDMATAGAPLIARFEGRRSGHALNNALLRALFADPAHYERV
ncbi:MAG TPA: UDP-3-O-acyl-N-acetylglucosamine deacetylase [Rhizomicrobium sp.]|jgi:UDP-3-O-[3-hydroxymyristoyl] N-acetylglucosamine deacetylase